nr:uracil-DNA glycosylase family protein [uncultured Capnocytophaga sp.]
MSKFTPELEQWAAEVIEKITPIAEQIDLAYYPLQTEAKMNPELLIIGLNPGSEGKYNEQKTKDKWEFKDGKMTTERLLKGNPFIDEKEEWKIFRGLNRIPFIKQAVDSNNYCFMNYVYFGTSDFEKIKKHPEAMQICKELTKKFIEIINPKHIIVLGLEGMESISKIEKTLLKGKTKRLLVQGGDLFGKQVLAISHPSYAVSTAEYEAIDTNIKEFYEGKPLKPFTFKSNVTTIDIDKLNTLLGESINFKLRGKDVKVYEAQLKGIGDDVLDFRIDLRKNPVYLSFRSLDRSKKLENTEVYKNTFKEPFSIEVNAWFVEKFLNNYPQHQAIEEEIADDLLSLLNAIKAQQ